MATAARGRKPALSVVKPGDVPEKPRPKSITEAASSGDHLALLEAMRDRIAKTVQSEDCPPRDLASLTRRLDDIARQIKALKLEEKVEGDAGAVSAEEFDASAI